MDIFQTTITAGEMVYAFISSCAEFSSDAKSLSARFEWDLRLLKQFLDFFRKLEKDNGGKLADKDQELLDKSVVYLGHLSVTIQTKRSKIESKGWLTTQFNRARWVLYKSELKELEKELFEWTHRLDLHLVALPPEVMSVIHLDETTKANAPRLATRMRIEKYVKMTKNEKTKLQDSLFISDEKKEIEYSQNLGRRVAAKYKQRSVVVEYRAHSNALLSDHNALEVITDDTRNLAASLSFVDPTVIGLFRCAGYFCSPDPNNPRFGLVYDVPFPLSSEKPQTLKDLLQAKDDSGHRYMAMHALDKRIRLARRLASALYFIHALGWLHKSVRSNNVLMLEPSNISRTEAFPNGLGHPYLVSFESARHESIYSDLTVSSIEDQWHLNVYRHPHRQGITMSTRHTMAHDIYSLGVVLLEIGLWRPFERIEKELKGKSPEGMQKKLLKLAEGLAITLGTKYQTLVVWCLNLDDGDLGATSYVEHVLEVLDELNI